MYLFLKVQFMLIVLHRNMQKDPHLIFHIFHFSTSKVWKDLNMLQAIIMLPVPRNQNVLQLPMNYATKIVRVRF